MSQDQWEAYAPDWMRRIRGWEEAPAWLRMQIAHAEGIDLSVGYAEGAAEGFDLSGIPGFAGSGQDVASVGEDAAAGAGLDLSDVDLMAEPTSTGSGVTDWLRQLVGEPTDQAPTAGEPAASVQGETSPAGPAVEGEAERDADLQPPRSGVTDWLLSLEGLGEEGDQAGAAPGAAEGIDWVVPGAEGEGPTSDEALPDWLVDLEEGGEQAPAQAAEGIDWVAPGAEGQGPTSDEALPDWLVDLEEGGERALAQAEEESDRVAPGAEGEGSPTPQPPGEELLADEGAPVEGLPEVHSGVTEWLTRLEAEGERQEPDLPQAASAEAPDWLAELRASGAEATPSERASLPDWLAELQEEAPADASATGLVGAQEVPDWLAALSEDADQVLGRKDERAQAVEEGPSQEGEVPEWLRGLVEDAPDAAGPVEPEEAALQPLAAEERGDQEAWLDEEARVPDWLTRLPGDLPEASVVEEAQQEEPVVEESPAVPDWLQDIDALLEEEREEGLSTEVVLPDWIQETVEPAEEAPFRSPVEAARPADEEHPFEEGYIAGTPAWMEDAYAESEPLTATEAEALPGLEGEPIEEAPAWLDALREGEMGIDELPVETSGPLAGLKGVLSPEPLLAILPQAEPRAAHVVPEAQLAEAKLVEAVLSEPSSRRMRPSGVPTREILNSVARWGMYVLLLATILVAPLQSCIRIPDLREADDFYRTVEAMPAGSEVLVVVDYDPSLDGELTPQLRAIVWHLLQQDVRIVLVSLTPQGTAIAQDVLDEQRGATSGREYIDLGYLPPHPAALQAFVNNPLGGMTLYGATRNPLGTRLGQSVQQLADLDLMIMVSGERDHIRWWVEQVGTRTEAGLLVAVTSAVTPYLRPYYSEAGGGQIVGMLTGLGATAQYESSIGAQYVPSARANYVVQANVLILLALAMLGSGIASLVLRPSGRRGVGALGASTGEDR
ncbi:MAG: hypothetical protein JXA09_12355 [Anaerolineae bacterium]|nr:hypothetical protein [Anaerolineae bacterium]